MWSSQTPLQEQLGPDMNTIYALENMSSKVIAAQINSYDWELFNTMHEVGTVGEL